MVPVLSLHRLVFWVLAAAFSLAVLVACSANLGTDDLERRAQAVDRSLICPVCPGETIDQSRAELARQMRSLVREQLAQGATENQVRQYFVEKYGPSVLAAPPQRGFSAIAWIVPPIGIVLGLLALGLVVRGLRKRTEETVTLQASVATPADLQPYLSKVDESLRQATGLRTPPQERHDG
jgi:cytochrome c-type biogenesis protein CcmH